MRLYRQGADADGAPAGPTDEELFERFRQGDARAFEVLVSRHGTPLYNFILRQTGQPALAEDLVQEVFLRAIRHAEAWQRRSRLTTWLYRIARNACIDAARRQVHRRHASLDAPASGDPDGRPLVETLAGDCPGADRQADGAGVRDALREALAALPAEQREVFLLRQMHGLTFKEVAEITQVPVNTVKSRMRYALEALRRHLAPYRGETP